MDSDLIRALCALAAILFPLAVARATVAWYGWRERDERRQSRREGP